MTSCVISNEGCRGQPLQTFSPLNTFEKASGFSGRLKHAKDALGTLPRSIKNKLLRESHEEGKSLARNLRQSTHAQGMSNAWLKAYEMYQSAWLLSCVDSVRECIFFNAELPGSFIAAANHWCYSIGKAMPTWYASSLRPDVDDTALGDIYGLCAANPRNWLMTSPEFGVRPGDIRFLDGVDRLVRSVRERSGPECPVALYVSDAGIDYDPETEGCDQETLCARVHLGQVLCCLETLREGGSALMKFYTFFRPWTFTLLGFLADVCFEETSIIKPSTSRITNSEVYFVGKGYKGRSCIPQETMSLIRLNLLGSEHLRAPNKAIRALPFNMETLVYRGLRFLTAQRLLAAMEKIHIDRQCVSLRELVERGKLFQRRTKVTMPQRIARENNQLMFAPSSVRYIPHNRRLPPGNQPNPNAWTPS